MSTSLYWQPLKGRPLDGQSTVRGALERAFSRLPLELGEGDIPKLYGMAATWDGSDNPYEDLIEAIEKHGTIRVWAEY